jgi:hypothetical protein
MDLPRKEKLNPRIRYAENAYAAQRVAEFYSTGVRVPRGNNAWGRTLYTSGFRESW